MAGWFFPSNNFGIVTGIGDSGIETYKGSPFRSLAREICQNSIDARADFSKPVVVDFSLFTIQKRLIPNHNAFYGAISTCLEFWTEQKNKKTVDFFQKAKNLLDTKKVDVLRISDFNTTGLQGSDKEFNTPWQNLVKASGVSDKGVSDGGSFGIGKSAPFVCSALRTLFYSTKDVDGLEATQGVARLVSFREKGFWGRDKDVITSGIGFYGADERNTPIRKCISLDPDFERTECGTDIFILGFEGGASYKEEVICSVLDEFLIAIYNNELIVRIDGTIIDKTTLKGIIEVYKSSVKSAYDYYQVLTSKKAKVLTYTFPNLGSIELHILYKSGLNRKVMMCRKNGMKVFDKDRISRTVQFSGICVLIDDDINAYFKEMENPQHDAWEPERHSSDKKTNAKKNKTALFKYIKTEILSVGKKATLDQLDAEGVGEYLADIESVDFSVESEPKYEEADLTQQDNSTGAESATIDLTPSDKSALAESTTIDLTQSDKSGLAKSTTIDLTPSDKSGLAESAAVAGESFQDEQNKSEPKAAKAEAIETSETQNIEEALSTETGAVQTPVTPATSDTYATPATSDTYVNPATPATPDIYVNPATPATPATSDTDSNSATSAIPATSDTDANSATSATPATSDTYVNPATSAPANIETDIQEGGFNFTQVFVEDEKTGEISVESEEVRFSAELKLTSVEQNTAEAISMSSIRLFVADREKKSYTIIFVPEKSASHGFLTVSISGEQVMVDVPVLNAFDLISATELKCEGNKIFLSEIQRSKKYKLSFTLDFPEDCSMEVKLYGFAS